MIFAPEGSFVLGKEVKRQKVRNFKVDGKIQPIQPSMSSWLVGFLGIYIYTISMFPHVGFGILGVRVAG